MSERVGFVTSPELPRFQPGNDVVLLYLHYEALDEVVSNAGVLLLSAMGLSDDYDQPGEWPFLDPGRAAKTFQAILRALHEDPDLNPETENPELLIEELEEIAGLLKQLAKDGVQFRFLVG